MKDYIVYAVAFIGGIAAFSIFGLQILISLFCTFPVTSKMQIVLGDGINAKAIRAAATRTIFINLIILGLIAGGLIMWGNRSVIIGAAFGAGFSLLLSLGKCGPSNNIADYFNAYRRHFSDEALSQINDWAGMQ